MQTTPAWETLKQFRLAAYQTLGRRKDSLFELLEAVLAGPGPATLVRLSLAAVFRRAWPSAPDALADGGVDVDRCRGGGQRTPIEPAPERPIWALDGTVWPRPSAKTSPERTYGHRTTAGIPQDGVVPAWEYEWLVAVPAPGTGWVLPLDVERRGPSDGTPTAVAIGMLRGALARRPVDAPRPVCALDSGYDPIQVARADLPIDVLVRLRSNRVFYRAPGPYQGRGAPVSTATSSGWPIRSPTGHRTPASRWPIPGAAGSRSMPGASCGPGARPMRPSPSSASSSNGCRAAPSRRRRSGWPGPAASCPRIWPTCGATTS